MSFQDAANALNQWVRHVEERRARAGEQQNWDRSRRVTEWGFLGPGDPPPLPERADQIYDYRGLVHPEEATVMEMSNIDGHRFPTGAYCEVRFPAERRRPGPAFHLGVPFDTLREHAVIVGRSGSGKTRFLIVPWIYTALFSSTVVTLDAKGDMLDLIKERSAEWGSHGVPAAKWDYIDPNNSASWNWMDEIDDEHSLDAVLTAILGREEEHAAHADPHFYRRDRQILGGLLKLAPVCRFRTTSDILRLLADPLMLDDVFQDHPDHPGAIQVRTAIGDLGPDDYRKAISGVTAALQELSTPKIDQVTSGKHRKITLDDLLKGRKLLVVVTPEEGGHTAGVLAGLFLNLFAQRLARRFRQPQHNHVFLFVDEAPYFVPKFNFPRTLSICRSADVSVVLALQDVAQFEKEHERSAIISNCGTWISLAGGEEASIKALQGRLGKHNVSFWNQGAHGHRPGVDLRLSVESRPVLGEREIASPPGRRPAIIQTKDTRLPRGPILVDLQPQAWTWS